MLPIPLVMRSKQQFYGRLIVGIVGSNPSHILDVRLLCTRWFKYDRDYLCVNKSQFVPVIFESPCMLVVVEVAAPVTNRLSVQRSPTRVCVHV
jgi:hypothetical protein